MSYASLATPDLPGIDLAAVRRAAIAASFAAQSAAAAAFIWCLLAAPGFFQ